MTHQERIEKYGESSLYAPRRADNRVKWTLETVARFVDRWDHGMPVIELARVFDLKNPRSVRNIVRWLRGKGIELAQREPGPDIGWETGGYAESSVYKRNGKYIRQWRP
jgi:hypothetical protein